MDPIQAKNDPGYDVLEKGSTLVVGRELDLGICIVIGFIRFCVILRTLLSYERGWALSKKCRLKLCGSKLLAGPACVYQRHWSKATGMLRSLSILQGWKKKLLYTCNKLVTVCPWVGLTLEKNMILKSEGLLNCAKFLFYQSQNFLIIRLAQLCVIYIHYSATDSN